MIPSIHYILGGYRVLTVDCRDAADLLELCRRKGYIYEDFRTMPDGTLSLRFPRTVAARVEEACSAQGISVATAREGGLPRAARWVLGRPGLLVGLLLSVCLWVAAGSVVWDIRISGNHTVSDKAIRQSLAECGFSVGTLLRGLEMDKIENEVLMQDDRLAWISINRKGTVAHVEVREKTPRPASAEESPCDVVAAVGGVIQYIELEEGNVRVTAGQAVDAGDVLVSGLYDSMTQGIRITAARARVFARTARVLSVEIPMVYTQKVYQSVEGNGKGGIGFEKSVNFFENYIKFSKKTGNLSGFYDTIEEETSWGPLRGVGFPVSTCTVWYIPYEIVTVTRTPQEAEELAYFELAKRIAELGEGTELLSKTVTIHRGPDTLTLTCTLTCIEDIGTVRPILVEE